MTVSSNQRQTQWNGDGLSFVFPTQFTFLLPTDVQVYKKLIAATTWNLLAYGTQWTMAGGGNGTAGNILLAQSPLVTETILIVRNVPYTQLVNFSANDTFPAETMEASLDKLTEADQQLDGRLSVLEAAAGVIAIPSEPYIFTNNAIIALKNTITQNAAIPAGYNAMAILPVISNGVTITVAAGSTFITLDNSLGGGNPPGGGPFALLTTNVFSGRQDFGAVTANYVNRIDPAYGDHYILKNAATALPVNTFTGEFNAFAGDVQEQSGTDSLVALHGFATSKLTHAGNAVGVEGFAINTTDKNAAGLGATLYGGIFIVENQMFTHTSPTNSGLYIDFRNRSGTGGGTPTNGSPGANQGYNKNFSAITIDCLQERGTLSGITCGWQTGIMFTKRALDKINGGALAVGIDMTAFDLGNVFAGDGTPYGSRLAACIALPTGWNGSTQLPGITWDTAKTISTLYSNVGTWEVRQATSMRFAVHAGVGLIYAGAPSIGQDYSKYLDLIGFGQYLLSFSLQGGKAGTAPSNTAAPQAFIKVRADSADAWIPLYF
jgi:hypothetical protein